MRILPHTIVLVLVLAAGSGIYWIDTLRRTGPSPEADSAPSHEPEAYFVDFTSRRFERPGPPVWQLAGERMTRFADDQTARVQRPDLDYRPPDAAPWRVTAAEALANPDGTRVELIREVVARQHTASRSRMTLRTNRLTVLTDAGRADTERPVTARGPGWRVDATGMTAWFDRNLVELHHDVDGHYAP